MIKRHGRKKYVRVGVYPPRDILDNICTWSSKQARRCEKLIHLTGYTWVEIFISYQDPNLLGIIIFSYQNLKRWKAYSKDIRRNSSIKLHI